MLYISANFTAFVKYWLIFCTPGTLFAQDPCTFHCVDQNFSLGSFLIRFGHFSFISVITSLGICDTSKTSLHFLGFAPVKFDGHNPWIVQKFGIEDILHLALISRQNVTGHCNENVKKSNFSASTKSWNLIPASIATESPNLMAYHTIILN